MKDLIVSPEVDSLIYTIRGHRVMLDYDLAKIYGVVTWHLNQAVKRNRERFPEDFMFQLTRDEQIRLTSQNVMSKKPGRGGRRTPPYAFTEHGAVMLGMVLKSPVAVAANVGIVRAFNRLRQLADKNKDLAAAFDKLERQVRSQGASLAEHADNIKTLFAAIHEIMEPPIKPSKKIGFSPK